MIDSLKCCPPDDWAPFSGTDVRNEAECVPARIRSPI